MSDGRAERVRVIALMAALLALNAYVCGPLFSTEVTKQLGSIESAMIAFSRWQVDHWEDRSWFPMWVLGTPVRQVYQPVLHATVAQVARLAEWTSAHAYHFVTAAAYCLGPVTLFWLIWRGSRRWGWAALSAAIYSLVSPSVFLMQVMRDDAGGLWGARRFQTLVMYGEGPHVAAMTLIPLAIWLVDEAASRRRWWGLLLAPVGLALVVLTNWTGTTGLTMAVAAYAAAKLGSREMSWPSFAGLGLFAYLLAAPWIPPSLIRSVQEGSSNLDLMTPPPQMTSPLERALAWACLAGVMAGAHWLFQKYRAGSAIRFFVCFGLIAGAVVGARVWIGWVLVPIGYRFHLEMEMAMAAVGAFIALAIAARLPRWARVAALGVLVVGGAAQMIHYARYMRAMAEPVDFTQTLEYEMAQWFAANAGGRRVFAPSTVSYWMNVYSDTPQFYGAFDQSVRSQQHRIATYVIYSSDGAGDRAGEISTLWLKAYGVSAVAVADLNPQVFGQPGQFDGLLPELWRKGQSAIYDVGRAGDTLAHVIPRESLVARPPVNGIDVEPLEPLVAALDDPASAAGFRWLNQHEAEIVAQTGPGEVIFVQQTYDPGWHAYENGAELQVSADILGLTIVEPPGAGPHTVRMVYSGGLEDRVVKIAQAAGAVLLIGWVVLSRRRLRPGASL